MSENEGLSAMFSRKPFEGAVAIPQDHPLAKLLLGAIDEREEEPDFDARLALLRDQLELLRDPDAKLGDVYDTEQSVLGEMNAILFRQQMQEMHPSENKVRFHQVDIPVSRKSTRLQFTAGSAILEVGTMRPGMVTLFVASMVGIDIMQQIDYLVFHESDTPIADDVIGSKSKYTHAATRVVDGEVVHIYHGEIIHVG